MHMWPQLALLGLTVAGATITLTKDRTWSDVVCTLFAHAVTQSLLYAGGWYNVFLR